MHITIVINNLNTHTHKHKAKGRVRERGGGRDMNINLRTVITRRAVVFVSKVVLFFLSFFGHKLFFIVFLVLPFAARLKNS